MPSRAERRALERRRAQLQRQANRTRRAVRMRDGTVIEPEPRPGSASAEEPAPRREAGAAGAEARPRPGRSPGDPEAVELRGSGEGPRPMQELVDAVAERDGLRARLAICEDRLQDAVEAVRLAGVPWRVVGEALGVSHVAALKRYG